MTAKERVLEVHRFAHCYPQDYGAQRRFIVADTQNWDCKRIGEGETEEAAWQNAARSLSAQPEQELKCQCTHLHSDHWPPSGFTSGAGCLKCNCTGFFAKPVETLPVEAKEKEPETTKIPCYEVYDTKDIDCTVFQHERMNDLQEFVYQLLDGLEDGESIRIEFKNYTQEELNEVYDEL